MFTDYNTYRLLVDERVQDIERWSQIRHHRRSEPRSAERRARRARRARRWL
jgi:hypothetical protein